MLSLRTFAVSVALLVLAVGCGSGAANQHRTVVAGGRIGPLRVDRSDRRAVVRFAGRPDSERYGSESGAPQYDALGYGCRRRSTNHSFPLVLGKGPSCRTVFWLDLRSGKLEDFFTSDPRYVEAHGIRIGTSSETADERLHQRLTEGCEENLHLSGRNGELTIAFEGGSSTRTKGALLVHGARVFAFVVHSRRRGSGVFDCL